MNLADAIDIVNGDVKTSDELQAYLKLLNYVYEHRDTIEHLSYSKIAKVMGVSRPDLVFKAAQYFSGNHVKLLQMNFELIIDDECLLLDHEQVYSAEITGVLIHPEKGYPVADYTNHVFPFFTLTEEVKGG